MHTLIQRTLRLSISGVVMAVATASFGQRFVSIADLNPAGMQSRALGVDDQGEVVGTMWDTPGHNIPCFSRDGAAFEPVDPEGFGIFGLGEATAMIAAGPSGTRLIIGNQIPSGAPARPFLAIVSTDRHGLDTRAIQNLQQPTGTGTDSFGFDANGNPLAHPGPGYRYDSPNITDDGLSGASRAFALTQAAKDVVLTPGGAVSDVYYIVGEYEWKPGTTHAALWRVVIPSDSYTTLSGVTATLYDLHTASGTSTGGSRSMGPGTSTARAIMKYSERSHGTVDSFCVIGGSLGSDVGSEQGATWLESADLVPDTYELAAFSTPLAPGDPSGASCVNSLYYRRDKDSASRPFVGDFVGSIGSGEAFQALGSTAVQPGGVGAFNSVALTGGDRGDTWAVGQIDGKAQLLNYEANTLVVLKNLVTSSTWVSLEEANGVSGKVVVGTGTVGGQSHAYKLTLR